MSVKWELEGMKQDEQSITQDWQLVNQTLIDGVVIREVKNVPTNFGYLTEVYRADWQLDDLGVDQIFQSVLEPDAISAWHAHAMTTDRFFVSHGLILIVLFDSRKGSPTFGLVNEFRFGILRPALVIVPPLIWHGIKNTSSKPSTFINIVDQAYKYEQPDHYRLPLDSTEIPYRFNMKVKSEVINGEIS